MTRRVAGLALLAAAACTGTKPIPELARAEKADQAGRPAEALRDYRAAQTACRGVRDPVQRRAACSEAHLGEGESLADLGRPREAAAAFERAAATLGPDDPAAAARAELRAGQIRLDLGEDRRAYELLWRVVTDAPDQAFAADALAVLVRDGRRRDPRQLYQVLGQLYGRLATSEVGDNLLFALADLAEHELADPAIARAHLDRLAADYPRSGLRDDALWHGARLSRALHDGAGAARRLRALLATREVSWGGAGSYFSVWLDDAQLELGRVLRDDLGRPDEALAAFARLEKDYPASILIDDALYERAVTLARAGRAADACRALADLHRRFPDSRYELEQAPAQRRTLACAPSGL